MCSLIIATIIIICYIENRYYYLCILDMGVFINKVLSLFFIFLCFPVYLICVLLIMFTSGFPIIFRHKRVGLQGKEFNLLKFRTMKKNAEEILKQDTELYEIYKKNRFKIPVHLDKRITWCGKILRKLSFDELPQFFNVLKGDMNIVGPRPMLDQEIDYIAKDIGMDVTELRMKLLSIRPGITGPVQTSGRSNLEYKKRIEIELEYINNRSLRKDCIIILKTPLAYKDAF